MKHLWVVESSDGGEWDASGDLPSTVVFFDKTHAEQKAGEQAESFPGLKWRVSKYERVGEK